MIDDPRIARLAGEAQETADAYDPYRDVWVQTLREDRKVQVSIPILGPVHTRDGEGITASTYLTIDRLEELLRNLLAAYADLVKLENSA